MTEAELWQMRLQQAQQECQKHVQRLRYLQEKAAALFPMEATTYLRLDDDTMGLIDQLLFRFGKLQDTIGQRIFPALLHVMLEWQDNQSFLDRLNRLETLKIIPSTNIWINLRELRNLLTHEYPNNAERNVQTLNLLWLRLPELLTMWESIYKKMVEIEIQ